MKTKEDDVSSMTWRGFGGWTVTRRDVEFERSLDKVALWVDEWNHNQRCRILEGLLAETAHAHMQFLWTVIQPATHRDLMYTANKVFPEHRFQPISTYDSRKIKRKLQRMRRIDYHRIASAYLQRYSDVTAASRPHSPPQNSMTSAGEEDRRTNHDRLRPTPGRRLTQTQRCSPIIRPRKRNSFQAAIFDGKRKSLSWFRTAPPCLKFIEMPVRRHIQDERNTFLPENRQKAEVQARQKDVKSARRKLTEGIPDTGRQLLEWYAHDWTELQKNEFLHKILLKFDPRQHYFMFSLLQICQHRDFIGLLPEVVSLKILNYLRPTEIIDASKVSKTWHRLCSNDTLWNKKCRQVKIDASPFGGKVTWKRAYKKCTMAHANWKVGKYVAIDCRGHTDRVLSVTFCGARMATGSADRTVRVWALPAGACLLVLRGHSRGVWCLRYFTDTLLVSGAYDCTIKVWNLRAGGSCARTLLGHSGPVWAMARRHTTLVSASQDRTAKVWDVSRCQLLHTLKGHSEAVFAVDMDEPGEVAVTGSADRSVRLWRVRSGSQIRVLWPDAVSAVMAVRLSDGYLACAHGNVIDLYRVAGDRTTAVCLRSYREHSLRIETIELHVSKPGTGDGLPSGVMVSGGKDGFLKYWHLGSEKSIHTLCGHVKQINCIQSDHTRIASASYDNQVIVWDFSVLS